MVVTATLTRAGRGTKVGVAQDLQLSGAAAHADGMIGDVSAVLMRDFAANMQNRIERIERGESATSCNQNVKIVIVIPIGP